MASQYYRGFFPLILLSLTFFLVSSSNAQTCGSSGGIAVYWGQNPDEGTLRDACATGNYKYVVMQYLYIHDNGSDPELNFASHTEDFESEIIYCQSQDIKVMLSIGQDATSITQQQQRRNKALKKKKKKSNNVGDDTITQKVAEYIYNNFLGGDTSGSGPFGKASLDGIDFSSIPEGENIKWVDLVRAINATTNDKKIYLSASPQCVIPDYYLGEAIETGLFDYIWVEYFYYNPCEYLEGNSANLLESWNKWTSNIVLPNNTVFLGIPASSDATGSGYIEPEVLTSEILPELKKASNYGGIMLYNRYFDSQNGYSDKIKDSVPKGCRCVCDDDSAYNANKNLYGLLRQS